MSLFPTITGRDWALAMARSRMYRNPVCDQIREAIESRAIQAPLAVDKGSLFNAVKDKGAPEICPPGQNKPLST